MRNLLVTCPQTRQAPKHLGCFLNSWDLDFYYCEAAAEEKCQSQRRKACQCIPKSLEAECMQALWAQEPNKGLSKKSVITFMEQFVSTAMFKAL